MTTIQDVDKFIALWEKKWKYGILDVRVGRKYFKITNTTTYGVSQESAEAFVDMDGNIYKAASWNAPAKHIRGNIFSKTKGMEAIDSDGFIRYLR